MFDFTKDAMLDAWPNAYWRTINGSKERNMIIDVVGRDKWQHLDRDPFSEAKSEVKVCAPSKDDLRFLSRSVPWRSEPACWRWRAPQLGPGMIRRSLGDWRRP